MRLTHLWSRITCRWHWEWLSQAAWSAMAHAPAGIGILTCAGIGWVAWERLPAAQPPDVLPFVYVPPTTSSNVPEPWPVAVLAVGLVGLVIVRVGQ